MYETETIPINETDKLILSRLDLRGATFHRIENLTTGEVLQDIPDTYTPPPTADEMLATPRYEGVRYNANGKITGFVLPFAGKPTPNARTEIVTHIKEGHPDLPRIPRHFTIERCPEMTMTEFEEAYRTYGRTHPRTDDNPGGVLVRPVVMRAMRLEERERLTKPADPRGHFPSSGEPGSGMGLPSF